jgi:hypothetical protein
MTAISKIIAKNQITNGGPSAYSFTHSTDVICVQLDAGRIVILVQAENEFSASADHNVYMQDIIDLYRDNGIVVRELHHYCVDLASI